MEHSPLSSVESGAPALSGFLESETDQAGPSSLASWLFMVASGLTLIYGVMKVLNIAHGSLYAFGAYANAWLVRTYKKRGGGYR